MILKNLTYKIELDYIKETIKNVINSINYSKSIEIYK